MTVSRCRCFHYERPLRYLEGAMPGDLPGSATRVRPTRDISNHQSTAVPGHRLRENPYANMSQITYLLTQLILHQCLPATMIHSH